MRHFTIGIKRRFLPGHKKYKCIGIIPGNGVEQPHYIIQLILVDDTQLFIDRRGKEFKYYPDFVAYSAMSAERETGQVLKPNTAE